MRLVERMQHVSPNTEPATVQAARFELLDRQGGRHLATAVVAPSAPYASVRWPGETRLARKHGPGVVPGPLAETADKLERMLQMVAPKAAHRVLPSFTPKTMRGRP